MIHTQQGCKVGVRPTVAPPPAKTILEFLKDHPIEELFTLPDAQLKDLLAPYFPETRRALLPTEKPRKLGVGNRAIMQALVDNQDQINALLAARGLKV